MSFDGEAAGWADDPAVKAMDDLFLSTMRELAAAGKLTTGGVRMLDYGCGPGSKSFALLLADDDAIRPREVVAVDISEPMLAALADLKAKIEADHGPLPLEALHVDPAPRQIAALASFDVIAPGYVLHHIGPDIEDEVYATLAGALAEDGWLVASEFDDDAHANSGAIVGKLAAQGLDQIEIIRPEFDMEILYDF
ncbi:uncharacterized protein AMSG_05218 [Thecamonas trahens ATCC 50062]|uniref:Methyltransferase type 12 domain-containing protein n=1 Tax=Thecamonas trahens ATCC 50062 TaxID=461836 RepID=A0A0L0DA47_THETB|nr:hypothetical protein AMSG_05218 [Thecamonas trahens ATCC 50062]KNC49229.1 hypothetical protein AMSG_05218 [Thecamonas trahens ATCC 50062]|eukprot:XP_013757947.1 hypothetical protein AMSG_05218 [Thecamonas trahens ATCC 50062]